ncbi:MAG: DUF368 domain-containing protein [Candidatus Dojkabacteria bacterium]|nr:MAG: DUF368 domain-containing protein [Candidatus Dojkabacteria bacterium]
MKEYLLKIEIRKSIKYTLFGFLMGCAEIVPGVSGSAIALMGGIYEGIVEALFRTTQIAKTVLAFLMRKATFKDVRDQILKMDSKFVVPLGFGVLFALVTMTSAVLWMLDNYPYYLFAILLALLLAASVVPYMEMKRKGWRELLLFAVTFIVFSWIVFQDESSMITDPSYLLLLVAGFFGISGMILPGVSGGVILLVMGVYYYIIDTVHSLITLTVTPEQLIGLMFFGVGAAAGFFTISILMRKLLISARSLFMAFVMALVLSSAPTLWPFVDVTGYSESGKPIIEQVGVENFTDRQILTMVLLFALVFGTTFYLNWRSYKKA